MLLNALFLSSDLSQLTATETMNYDDAFTLELVTEQLLDKFNFVAGIVPVLTTHTTKVDHTHPSLTCCNQSIVCISFQYGSDSSPLLNPRSAYLVKGALENLSNFMSTANTRENKDRQKLLRNLRVSQPPPSPPPSLLPFTIPPPS